MVRFVCLAALCVSFGFPAAADKAALAKSINGGADAGWKAALKIWGWAEPGYQEHQSADLLAGMLKKAGFKVVMGVADIPTAFTAEFGSGDPVIGILGEYDALPGLSQEAVPVQQPIPAMSNGHGCGHHLFGVASAMAAMALAERIRKGEISATIRFYGTPAEEGGSGKTFMARAGLFDDCDAVLHWHPASANVAGDATDLARIAVKFRFHGTSAHAASAPDQGRSALDAVELTNYAAELLREHTPEATRIHHVITSGGGAPNVVPDFAEVFYYVRHPDVSTVREIYARLVKCAEAGALATETRLETEYLGGTHNTLPNNTLSKVTMNNLRELADLEYSVEEKQFAIELQKTIAKAKPLDSIGEVRDEAGTVSKGSTDVGDVSWVVPTTGFTTACWVPGTPGHSWQATAAGGTTIARKGMLLAARVLAATAWDLIRSPAELEAARKELDGRLEDKPYKPLLEKGQKAPLDYRAAPSLR